MIELLHLDVLAGIALALFLWPILDNSTKE